MAVATPPPLTGRRKFPVIRLVVAIVILAVIVFAIVLAIRWPFTESAVIQSLEEASSSKVEIKHFRGTYFPHPGCIAEGVTFRRGSNQNVPPLITIPKLVIQTNFLGLITKNISRIQADGMAVFIPSQATTEKFGSSSDVTIDELIANGATLKFQSGAAKKPPAKFDIHECTLRGIGVGRAVAFKVKLFNPEPPGEIAAEGKLGPLRIKETNETPVSGEYKFDHADLGVFKGVGGLLSSTGRFNGTLERIVIEGSTDTPEFNVSRSSHNVDLRAQFNAVVNARTGDVYLNQVDCQFWKTNVVWSGSIARTNEKSRITQLDMQSREGRIEDLLDLFISESKPPLTGITGFRGHIVLPSTPDPFLKRVQLIGDFGVDSGSFTKPQTQQDVNKLSAEARAQNDQNPATVLSDLKGHVVLKNGTATFSYLSFTIPGAFAIMQGNYDLISQKINLHGVLRLDATLSHMGHGPKALLLKTLEPFFKRKSKGSKVAVKITGNYDHPLFGVDLTGQKENATTRQLRRLYQKPTK